MAEAPRETVQLFSGLLGHMRQIVGEGACYAMLHYGAVEEGKRLGAGSPPAELAQLLERLDALLLQRTRIVEDDGARVTVRVRASPLVESEPAAYRGIVLGLVEGALTASRAARYRGAVTAHEGELLIELRRDG